MEDFLAGGGDGAGERGLVAEVEIHALNGLLLDVVVDRQDLDPAGVAGAAQGDHVRFECAGRGRGNLDGDGLRSGSRQHIAQGAQQLRGLALDGRGRRRGFRRGWARLGRLGRRFPHLLAEAGNHVAVDSGHIKGHGDQEGCTQGPAVVAGQRAGGRLGEQDAVAGQDDDEKERLERRVGDDPHAEEEGDEHQPGEGQASQHPGAGGQGGIEAGSGRGEPVVEGQHAACQGQDQGQRQPHIPQAAAPRIFGGEQGPPGKEQHDHIGDRLNRRQHLLHRLAGQRAGQRASAQQNPADQDAQAGQRVTTGGLLAPGVTPALLQGDEQGDLADGNNCDKVQQVAGGKHKYIQEVCHRMVSSRQSDGQGLLPSHGISP